MPLPMLAMAAAPILGTLIGLLVGLRVDQRSSRILALGSLLVVAAWAILMSALPHPRYPGPNAVLMSQLQWYGGSFIWLFIYAACGLAGPSLSRNRAAAAVVSVVVAIAMATVGMFALMYLACAYGNDCV